MYFITPNSSTKLYIKINYLVTIIMKTVLYYKKLSGFHNFTSFVFNIYISDSQIYIKVPYNFSLSFFCKRNLFYTLISVILNHNSKFAKGK